MPVKETASEALQEAGVPTGITKTVLTIKKVVNGYIVEEGRYPTILKVFYTGREVVKEVKAYFENKIEGYFTGGE